MAEKNVPKKVVQTRAKKSGDLAFFVENAVVRTRATRSSAGGRYNAQTRRLVVPVAFAGKKCAVAVTGDLVVVGVAEDGGYACHPSQHFVTLPVGTVACDKTVTLAVAPLPEAVKKSGVEAVAYRLPKPAKKTVEKKA